MASTNCFVFETRNLSNLAYGFEFVANMVMIINKEYNHFLMGGDMNMGLCLYIEHFL